MGYKKNLIKSLVKNIEKAAKKHILVDLFPATKNVIKLAAENNFDIRGYKHVIDSYGIKHALNKHNLIMADILKIPDIIKNADKIIFEGVVKGMPRFKYEKRYNGSIYYVEEIRKGKQTLNIVTIYKIKTPSDAKSE